MVPGLGPAVQLLSCSGAWSSAQAESGSATVDMQPDRELLLQAKPAAYKQPTWCAAEHNPAIGQLNGWSS